MKSRAMVATEGALYFILGAFPPMITELVGDEPLTTRHLFVIGLLALVGGCTALKAFFSQAIGNPQDVIVKNKDNQAIPTDPQS